MVNDDDNNNNGQTDNNSNSDNDRSSRRSKNKKYGEASSNFSLLSPVMGHRIILFVFIMIITALIADTSLSKISDLLAANLSRQISLIVYFVISAVYIAGQFIILRFIKLAGKDIQQSKRGSPQQQTTTRYFPVIYRLVVAAQYALIGIVVSVVIQLVLFSQYAVLTLMAAVTLSYVIGTLTMVFLARNFASWFGANRDLTIFMYAISAIALAVHLAFTIFFIDFVLSGLPSSIKTAFLSPPFFAAGSLKLLLSNIHTITSTVSFAITWIATVLLLYYHSQRIGQIKYWIIVSLPLVYFLSQFPSLFLNLFGPLIKADPIFYGTLLTLVFTLSKPAGGILFGIAFWIAARRIRPTLIIRNYLMISAYGFILLFTSDQAIVLIFATYPPFGLITVSFVGLSSYLVFIGISYSAISVSQDNALRREIRKFAEQESKLIDDIGAAQMEKDINKKLEAIMGNQDVVSQMTGVQPSLEEEDLVQYMDDVLKETKQKKEGEDAKE